MIDELAQIEAMSQERLYIWLHTLAGLSLDYQNNLQQQDQHGSNTQTFGKKPTFTLGANYLGYLVSTKSIMSRMWQRLLSRQILALQLETFKETKTFLADISTALYCQICEFKAVDAKAVRMRNFSKLSAKKFQTELVHEGASFEMQATMSI